MSLISGLGGSVAKPSTDKYVVPDYKYAVPEDDYQSLKNMFNPPSKKDQAWKYGTNTDEGDLNWPKTSAGGGGFYGDFDPSVFDSVIIVDGKPVVLDTGGGGDGGGDGGGGGGDGGGKVSWKEFDSGLAGPDWWKALKPSEVTQQTEQLANLNLLIPLLSPEDQRQVAQALYNADPKNFAHLNPEDKDFFPPPGVGRGIREKFQDMSRAESGLAALTKLAEATGTKEEKQGSGTRFLRNILDQMQDFSGGGQQTRQQFTEMMGSVDPTIKGASSEQKPFQSLARMLSQPFFSTGSLMNVSRRQDGQYVFGKENRGLFF